MPLRIFHMSDLHLGMRFAGYPERREDLVEARFATLESLVSRAGAESCDLLVVAGDLFDRVTVTMKILSRAAEILAGFEGQLAAVMPGNHDYVSSAGEDLWDRLAGAGKDNLLFLTEPRVYDLRDFHIDGALYPAPCQSKHAAEHALGWIAETGRIEGPSVHVGVAHGSMEGVSPDFDRRYFPMTEADLIAGKLDLWLLGHTHNPHPRRPGRGDRIFYPGTPEPDGMDCDHGGTAWIHEVSDDRTVVSRLLENTGRYRFEDRKVTVKTEADLERLAASLTDGFDTTVLRLRLSGRLPPQAHGSLGPLRERLEEKVMLLRWDDYDVAEQVTTERIDQTYKEGSFPHRLLHHFADRDDLRALQLAFDLMGEAGE